MRKEYIQYIARFFSVVGHPLLTISILVYFLSHQELSSKDANRISMIIIGGITIPILLHNLWKTRKGDYSNFDVSNQQQRKKFFPFAIALLTIVSIYFWWSGQSPVLVHSTFIFLILLILFAFVNFKIKASMHAGINFYIVSILLHYNLGIGIGVLLLSVLVALSRLVLKRHTLVEIVIGTIIGLACGWVNTRFL
ncbi:MAG: hypothetical protein DI598_08975 [Pseudopedobacter saltans]|uniref:Phosphatidic acid phosphatase type 2/haloperoxidase domain-containing protein n=1 Tax=Pseudopedobacter saltans TaxID=151895 RepID=A0A2W5F544_9SPHI|nr:MAG: hypothetical protein DI598_08975 [Pseudopedobacter saltans]